MAPSPMVARPVAVRWPKRRRDLFRRVLPVDQEGGWEVLDGSLRIDVETLSPAAQKEHAQRATLALTRNRSYRVVHLLIDGDGDEWSGTDLPSALSFQTDLVELRISGGNANAGALLLAFLAHLPNLRHLAVFGGNFCGGIDVLRGFEADLEELLLSCVSLEGVRSIAGMRSLPYLCIYRARFGDDGMALVARIKGLEDLELTFDRGFGGAPTVEGLLALTGAPDLKFVDLSYTAVRRSDLTPDVIARLKGAFVFCMLDGATIFDRRGRRDERTVAFTRHYYHRR